MSKPLDGINALNYLIGKQPDITLYRNLSIVVMDVLCSLVLPLIRHNFGERFFSLFWVTIMMIATLLACWYWQVNHAIISIYMGLLFTASLYHLFVIIRRNRRDEIWHSRYEGDSNFLWVFRHLPKGNQLTWAEGLYEPLIVLIVASLLSVFVDYGLAGIFAVSAMCLAIRARIRHYIWRQGIIDDRDRMIESEGMLSALNGVPAGENNGLSVMDAGFLKPNEKRAKARQVLTPEMFAEHFPDPPKDFSSSVTTTH